MIEQKRNSAAAQLYSHYLTSGLVESAILRRIGAWWPSEQLIRAL